jgi:hypothetical protein
LRYRKPYTTRHTSVSWNLMLGKNPLWVARQHGHRIATMLSVYAAWVEGTRECDLAALRRAMGYEKELMPNVPAPALVCGANPLRTGWGGKAASLTIRVRVDPAAFDIKESPGKTSHIEESRPPTMAESCRVNGQKSATATRANTGKSLKGMRKTGGADGTRTLAPAADSIIY